MTAGGWDSIHASIVPTWIHPYAGSRHSTPAFFVVEAVAGYQPSNLDLVRAWRPIGWAEEQGQIRGGVGPFLDRRMRERGARVAREQFSTRGDKSVRAQSIRGRMALEGLYVDAGAPWFADFRSELLSFPAGRHDDQVDAIGLIGQLLDKMVPPAKEKPKVPTMRDRWDKVFSERPEVNWKTV